MADDESRAVERTVSLQAERRARGEREAHAAVLSFARDSASVTHGGMAIRHHLLPHGGDIYPADGPVPDVDLFTASRGAASAAAALVEALRVAGCAGASAAPARHRGTWTVRVRGKTVSDVTEVRREDMAALRRAADAEGGEAAVAGARRGRGRGRRGSPHPLVAPVCYLKQSMHLELARPTVFVERWRKVAPRLRALYGTFPTCSRRAAATPPREATGLLASLEFREALADALCSRIEDVCETGVSLCLLAGRDAARRMLGDGEGAGAAGPLDFVVCPVGEPPEARPRARAPARRARARARRGGAAASAGPHPADEYLGGARGAAVRALEACVRASPALRALVEAHEGAGECLTSGTRAVEESLFLPRHFRIDTTAGTPVARLFEMAHPIPFAGETPSGGLVACGDAVLYLLYGDHIRGAEDAGEICDALASAMSDADPARPPLLARYLPEPLLLPPPPPSHGINICDTM